MNYFYKSFLYTLLLLLAVTHVHNSCFASHAIIIPRSQSVDAARELVGWQQFINRCDQNCWYGVCAFTAEYQQNFNGAQLARCLFGNDIVSNNSFGTQRCGTLTVSGSQVAGRSAHDWLADYFGLPTDFKSVVTFCPRIQNAIFDLNFYLGLDEWTPGLFFRLHAPLVWTKWNLRATENIVAVGQNSYSAGYMSATSISRGQLPASFLLATDGAHGVFGDVTADFQYGIIGNNCLNNNSCDTGCNRRVQTRVADVELALGWNFLCCEDYHLGLELRGSGPAGNTPSSHFLFEPIVGNGHYATLGVGLTSHYMFWRNYDDTKSCGVWFDANITHLFKNCQLRSFDFKNKPNSRYGLLETVNVLANAFSVDLTAGSPAAALFAQYVGTAGGLIHAINATTFNVNTSFAVQADMAVKVGYQQCGWAFDIGYNAWVRSQEKICRLGSGLPTNNYALKGDAFIYGFSAGSAVPLLATESASTIHAGTNTPVGTPFVAAQLNNPSIDYAQLAFAGDGTTPLTGPNLVTQTHTSAPPVLLSDADINYCGAPRALTNKLFAHVNYTWTQCNNWTPFFGCGGSIEFAQNCGCAVSQWAAWLKAGVSYN